MNQDQISVFLYRMKTLYNYQSGFWSKSTNLCLCFFTHKVLKEFDEGLPTGMISINLQKAFNAKEHEILLQNLKAIRFSDSWESECFTLLQQNLIIYCNHGLKCTIKWFKSYLSGRIFLANIENNFSDFGKISFRMTQGSILGPCCFWSTLTIYRNK